MVLQEMRSSSDHWKRVLVPLSHMTMFVVNLGLVRVVWHPCLGLQLKHFEVSTIYNVNVAYSEISIKRTVLLNVLFGKFSVHLY